MPSLGWDLASAVKNFVTRGINSLFCSAWLNAIVAKPTSLILELLWGRDRARHTVQVWAGVAPANPLYKNRNSLVGTQQTSKEFKELPSGRAGKDRKKLKGRLNPLFVALLGQKNLVEFVWPAAAATTALPFVTATSGKPFNATRLNQHLQFLG